MKSFTAPRIILSLYLLTLLWLLLFKFSYDLPAVLLHYGVRSLNLVPFSHLSRGDMRGAVENAAVFVPLGLLAGVNFKGVSVWRLLACIACLSAAVEVPQFAFAIGITDTTDVITNSLGGALGLGVYGACTKYMPTEKVDRSVVAVNALLLLAVIVLRVFVARVRY